MMNNLNIFQYYKEFPKTNYAIKVGKKRLAAMLKIFKGKRIPIFILWITGTVKLVDKSLINNDDVTMTVNNELTQIANRSYFFDMLFILGGMGLGCILTIAYFVL